MYQEFAYLYDKLMKNVDYQRWADHIEEIFRKNGRKPETVVDLGCGTGAVTNILAERGYQVTGVDISEDMLFVAREKARKSGLQVSYICQDMTELTLHRPVDAIICMCDGFNYILEEAKLKQTFQRIYQYLNPGGILVFDISTYYKLASILGNNTMADSDEEISFIWFNNFDRQSRILEMNLTFFKKENGLYKRADETHYQRAYYTEEITALLQESGFCDINVYSANDLKPPGKRNHRVFFSATV
ncbi:MAG: methyltransferase domain-containing protein [Clostridiales bacterium]|jgi:2-polyprenyl-3-methyl-5-hydroxy-6-metoxy-1,4-benzoquinol methylase|nr:methyltransferase domain-containing protein [Clostridiales bacterium]